MGYPRLSTEEWKQRKDSIMVLMDQGWTLRRAADHLDVPYGGLWEKLKKEGLPTKPAKLSSIWHDPEYRDLHLKITRGILDSVVAFLQQGMSLKEACKRVNFSRRPVTVRLKEEGLPFRSVNPDGAAQKRGVRFYVSDPKVRKARSKKAKEVWKDPEKAARITAGQQQEHVKEAKIAALRRSWDDPVKRAARLQAMGYFPEPMENLLKIKTLLDQEVGLRKACEQLGLGPYDRIRGQLIASGIYVPKSHGGNRT